ncbi:MAG: malate synthase A, partial [Gammaproteobacteria bacterium]
MNVSVNEAFGQGLVIVGPINRQYARLLTPEALQFIEELARRFGPRCQEVLEIRVKRQEFFDAGGLPDFLPETRHVREGDWTVAPVPALLQDRRVEITGPVDRKMVINALNSGASTFMADFEDSSSPTWDQMMDGQVNLYDAVRGTIDFAQPDGKAYKLNPKTAVLLVRPRGWHLHEKHCLVDGQPIAAGLFDFGLYFFHNARALIDKGAGPYFYLPKMESHREARLWNEVFNHAQDTLGILRGTIKATALVETLTAV